MNTIEFNREVETSLPTDTAKVIQWLEDFLLQNNISDFTINYIILDDEGLLEINQQYLNHDYYTDIITFPLEVSNQRIISDIFISIDRIRENAEKYNVTFTTEYLRVIIHGLLHMSGYNDKTEEDTKIMRSKETELIEEFYRRFA